MRVRYINPDQPIRDPVTKRYPDVESDGTLVVPENSFWVRRLLAREIERADRKATQPTEVVHTDPSGLHAEQSTRVDQPSGIGPVITRGKE
jgi:hypothetical protein